MKKTIKILTGISLILVILLSTCQIAFAKMTPSLQQIADLFNVCSAVKLDNQDSSTPNFVASVTGNTLTITVTQGSSVFTIDYVESGSNIITGSYIGDDLGKKDIWKKVTKYVVDCVEQFQGYAEGAMFNTMNSSQVLNYKIGTEGLEITDNINAETLYQVQINLGAVIPAIDVDLSINEADLAGIKDQIINEGKTKLEKGNVIFFKSSVNNLDYIGIGEKGGFSYLTDKSLVAAITTYFNGDSKKVDYFTSNYSTVAEGNKQFEGFKVEINPIKNITEEQVLGTDGTYNFVRVTIDKESVKEVTNPTPKNDNPSSSKDDEPVVTAGKLPKTGGEINKGMIALYATMCVAGVGVIVMAASAKKQK